MTKLRFEDEWSFCDGGGEYILLQAFDGDRSFSCKVTREAVEDLHGSTDTGASWTTLFDPLKQRAEQAIQTKFDVGGFESDGSILLTSKDVSS